MSQNPSFLEDNSNTLAKGDEKHFHLKEIKEYINSAQRENQNLKLHLREMVSTNHK